MKNMAETQNQTDFDYTFVNATARIALYDDLKSAPRITKINAAPTNDYIENLTTTVYEQSKLAGGKVPYSVIREVSENFIHAQFREIVVSILDDGNTIRFADQGPGIHEKEKAQQPGFSSAIEPMKDYIRGVGSGFPIVKDYLDDRDGSIVIEDNLTTGAVVTISLVKKPQELEETRGVVSTIGSATGAVTSALPAGAIPTGTMPVGVMSATVLPTTATAVPSALTVAALTAQLHLNDREKAFLKLFLEEGDLGVTDLVKLTGTPGATVHNTLVKLRESGLVETTVGKKRGLTPIGVEVASTI